MKKRRSIKKTPNFHGRWNPRTKILHKICQGTSLPIDKFRWRMGHVKFVNQNRDRLVHTDDGVFRKFPLGY